MNIKYYQLLNNLSIFFIIHNILMVFVLRDKSLFWTRAGWKNNWHPKCFNAPRPVNAEYTLGVRSRFDHHSFLRITQSYRNYSRFCRQFLYGDKVAEELMILELRNQFKIPLVCQTLTGEIKHGGQRRMADQLDRDFELISNNSHPYQLLTYQMHNKYIQKVNEDAQTVSKGEKTLEQIFQAEVLKTLNQQKQKLPSGQNLSIQRITEIILRVGRSFRSTLEQTKFRGPTGQFADYLQQRRPYTNPDNEKVGY